MERLKQDVAAGLKVPPPESDFVISSKGDGEIKASPRWCKARNHGSVRSPRLARAQMPVSGTVPSPVVSANRRQAELATNGVLPNCGPLELCSADTEHRSL